MPDRATPRDFLGWGNVSTLGLRLDAAKKTFPGRASVAVTGEAGLGYMLGNLGPGHDPFTHQVLGPTRWICRR